MATPDHTPMRRGGRACSGLDAGALKRSFEECAEISSVGVVAKCLDVELWTLCVEQADDVSPLAVRCFLPEAVPVELAKDLMGGEMTQMLRCCSAARSIRGEPR